MLVSVVKKKFTDECKLCGSIQLLCHRDMLNGGDQINAWHQTVRKKEYNIWLLEWLHKA
jgi:hypothetical protein